MSDEAQDDPEIAAPEDDAESAEAVPTRAELRVQRAELQRADAAKVRSEIEAAKEAEQAKTVRLRALRLAKEAADSDAAAAAPKKPTRKRKVAEK